LISSDAEPESEIRGRLCSFSLTFDEVESRDRSLGHRRRGAQDHGVLNTDQVAELPDAEAQRTDRSRDVLAQAGGELRERTVEVVEFGSAVGELGLKRREFLFKFGDTFGRVTGDGAHLEEIFHKCAALSGITAELELNLYVAWHCVLIDQVYLIVVRKLHCFLVLKCVVRSHALYLDRFKRIDQAGRRIGSIKNGDSLVQDLRPVRHLVGDDAERADQGDGALVRRDARDDDRAFVGAILSRPPSFALRVYFVWEVLATVSGFVESVLAAESAVIELILLSTRSAEVVAYSKF